MFNSNLGRIAGWGGLVCGGWLLMQWSENKFNWWLAAYRKRHIVVVRVFKNLCSFWHLGSLPSAKSNFCMIIRNTPIHLLSPPHSQNQSFTSQNILLFGGAVLGSVTHYILLQLGQTIMAESYCLIWNWCLKSCKHFC